MYIYKYINIYIYNSTSHKKIETYFVTILVEMFSLYINILKVAQYICIYIYTYYVILLYIIYIYRYTEYIVDTQSQRYYVCIYITLKNIEAKHPTKILTKYCSCGMRYHMLYT